MEVGLHIPQVGSRATPEIIGRFARAADAAGYDGLWVYDHVVLQKEQQSRYPYAPDGNLGFRATINFLEPLTLLTYLAGITKRVRLGTAVLVLPMRQPVLHAKIMSTIDFLSGGRFVLGAGIGWWKQEFEALSVPFERRGKRMEESLQLLRQLWTEEYTDFRGEFYEAVDWACNPKPVRPEGIPIWLGGESRAQLERAGKYADGWLATGNMLPRLREHFAIAQESAAAAGRDPSRLMLAVDGMAVLAPDRLAQTAEQLAGLRELGVGHAIVNVHPRQMAEPEGLLEEFAARHLPGLQAPLRQPTV